MDSPHAGAPRSRAGHGDLGNSDGSRSRIAPIVLIGQLQNRGILPWRTALVTDAPTVVHELERWG